MTGRIKKNRKPRQATFEKRREARKWNKANRRQQQALKNLFRS